jgi:hypothetical protein
MISEKTMLKRELKRVESLYSKLQREFKEQREIFNQLVDENASVRKQNSEYRGLIV